MDLIDTIYQWLRSPAQYYNGDWLGLRLIVIYLLWRKIDEIRDESLTKK